MPRDQILLFGLFLGFFALLVWGRIRYDLVAITALVAAVLLGLVEPAHAFEGFGHPAVIIIGLVLIVSRGLLNSGVVEALARNLIAPERSVGWHVALISLVGAALSAVINNVAALAMLMSIDLEAARKAGRPPGRTLMALSFATILGGMVTLIGTPPNIVISQYRQRVHGEPFAMFDFSPVGLVVTFAGILFVALIGWRLMPQARAAGGAEADENSALFVAEARLRKNSEVVGKLVSDLYPLASQHNIVVLGLVRRGKRLPGFARNEPIARSDRLVLEGDPPSIEEFMGTAGLDYSGSEKHGGLKAASLVLQELIVPDGAEIEGRTAADLRLQYRDGVTLLGVSRQGRRFRDRVQHLTIRAGDMLLMLGPASRLAEVANRLGILPLADRAHSVLQRSKALLAVGLFALAIFGSIAGWASLAVMLAACVAGYAAFGIVSPREVYNSVEWKVIVLVACLIPLSGALETSGATARIAGLIASQTAGWPAWAVLLLLMAVTMTLSDFLNNVATALIAAPIAIDVAKTAGASTDTFLMAVAVASSCAFLTPIGHKNNTIIMGPGEYRFADYWRMGLPLEILVLAVATPALVYFWPL